MSYGNNVINEPDIFERGSELDSSRNLFPSCKKTVAQKFDCSVPECVS